MDKTLEIIASVRACKDKSFNLLPPLVIERSSLLASCICILLSWDEERKKFIDHLKAIGVPVLVLVITDANNPLALNPESMKDRPENFHTLEVGKIQGGLASL